jgi:hypothetical protein
VIEESSYASAVQKAASMLSYTTTWGAFIQMLPLQALFPKYYMAEPTNKSFFSCGVIHGRRSSQLSAKAAKRETRVFALGTPFNQLTMRSMLSAAAMAIFCK